MECHLGITLKVSKTGGNRFDRNNFSKKANVIKKSTLVILLLPSLMFPSHTHINIISFESLKFSFVNRHVFNNII